jgi:hypothetical protein
MNCIAKSRSQVILPRPPADGAVQFSNGALTAIALNFCFVTAGLNEDKSAGERGYAAPTGSTDRLAHSTRPVLRHWGQNKCWLLMVMTLSQLRRWRSALAASGRVQQNWAVRKRGRGEQLIDPWRVL